MKLLNRGLALAVVGAGLAAFPTVAVQAESAAVAGDDGLSVIKQQADGTVASARSSATGKISFLAVQGKQGDLAPGDAGLSRRDAVAKAGAYLDQHAATFGARSGELAQTRVATNSHGTTITYTQQYKGIPVFGSMLKANVDAQGDLTSVSGYAAPDLTMSVEPRASAAQVSKLALAWVREDPPGKADGKGNADTSGIRAVDPALVVYRKGFVKGDSGEAVLAYQVEVTNGSNIRDMTFFDANTKKILNRYSMVNDALDRELYETSPASTPVWSEGDAFPGALNKDQQNLVNSAGESYWLYSNAFGRDSYNGAGAQMKTVNNDPGIKCPNANWNGLTTNYCDGVTSDDVVSHEWGHAYTEYTSGLIYQYQSGALNESYSDVWGETLDLINGREDEGESFTEKREVGVCDSTAPPALDFAITAPANAAGKCLAVAAVGAKPFTTTAVTATVRVGLDAADETGPSTTDGCTAFTNAAAIAGGWAFVDRGTCPFATKVATAKAAGATGIVIGNNNVDPPAGFTGDPDLFGAMITQADGARIKSAGEVTVSVTAADVSKRPETTRWLVGEKSTAFGGAIRDMWSPTCHGDPAKVTDAEYKCDPTLADGGGVHSNSGVPNHAYALLADGGTFNGQTVAGVGLDKAGNVWWRAQSSYLTPSSNFTDAANALEQSCVDLVGQPINKLSTQADAGAVPADSITATDCEQVTKAVAAVEMRTDPVRCDFQPVLAPNAPSICGKGFVTDALWSEDFEDGLAGWTTEQELADLPDYQGGFGKPWELVSKAPGDHASKVAYGPTPTGVGQCTGDGQSDFSSRDSIISPIVELPDSLRTPRLSFQHYVAIEAKYDGGNVKVSVNGKDFEVIPASAYIWNAPGQLATLEQGNTNPLAGEAGFTGTDGGQTRGSWGESQVDLTALGVKAGDTVQFRFDVGRDGCGGVDGWYVDDIKIVVCKLPTKITGSHLPEPSIFGEPSSVRVDVARDGNAGGAPTGDVILTKADGSVVADGTLKRGNATIALPADLPVGVHVLTATYEGSTSLASSSVKVTVTVNPATPPAGKIESTTKAEIRPTSPRWGRNFEVKIDVRGEDGSRPDGKVVVKIDGKKIAKEEVKNGSVVIKVTRTFTPGRHELVAKYRGNDDVKSSNDEVAFKISW